MIPILDQLWHIYQTEELWHEIRLPEQDFKGVKQYLIDKGLLWVEVHNGIVVGYMEVWKLQYAQWGRISCGELLYTYDEDLVSGNIAYIANLWISEAHRGSNNDGFTLIDDMQDKFVSIFGSCKYVALKRKHGLPYRVYPMKRIAKIGV